MALPRRPSRIALCSAFQITPSLPWRASLTRRANSQTVDWLPLYDDASPFCLSSLGLSCQYCRFADVLERELDELSCHRRALHVPVYAHFLRLLVGFLWVDDAVGVIFRPQVPFQT